MEDNMTLERKQADWSIAHAPHSVLRGSFHSTTCDPPTWQSHGGMYLPTTAVAETPQIVNLALPTHATI